MAQKPRIFISHAWEDKAVVRRLERELKAAGLEVWIDQNQTRAGDNLPKRINDALEWCDTLLLLWSKKAKASHWVQEEWTCAHSLQKQIIPCLLDDAPRPALLSSRLYIQFHDFDNSLRQLLTALHVEPLETPKQQIAPLAKPLPRRPRFRAAGHELSDNDVKQMLVENDFFDKFKKKNGKGFANDFELVERQGEKLVVDHAGGLMWQQSGSDDRPDYNSAENYVERLNRVEFTGFDDWRLPTLEEAMSLMECEEKNGDLYIDPAFDKKQRWIWTADKESASDVWVVLFNYGGCDNDHVGDGNYVRAVRSGQS